MSCSGNFWYFVLQIRVLCGVEHDDLKRVVHVSKSFRNAVHLEDCGEFDEVKALNAPKQWRIAQSRLIGQKAEEGWSRRELFMEMETEI